MNQDIRSHECEGKLKEEEELVDRRQFLQGLGKWSLVVIGCAVAAGTLLSSAGEANAAGWINHGGGRAGGWANRAGGGGAWANRAVGGGAWANRAGGGGAWANRGAGWANRGGAWVNRF